MTKKDREELEKELKLIRMQYAIIKVAAFAAICAMCAGIIGFLLLLFK